MKLYYTHKAISDLRRLHEFIAHENIKAAVEVSERLRQAIERLVDFPQLGKQVEGHQKLTSLRELITKKYVIRYAVLKNEVHILSVWHSREDRPSK